MPEFTLVFKYMKKHIKQILASVLCIATFTGAVLSMQLFNVGYEISLKDYAVQQQGFTGMYELNADKQTVESTDLQQNGIGAVYIYDTVSSDYLSGGSVPLIGYADPLAVELQRWQIEKGSMPTNGNEIAIEEKAYYGLRLTQQVGDTVTINTQSNGVKTEHKYILTGILKNYGSYVNDINSIQYPFAPQIVLGAKQDEPKLINLYYSPNCNSNLYFGGVMNSSDIKIDSKSVSSMNVISIAFSLFFFVMLIFGVYNVVKITYKEREQYIGLMRCVGLTCGQAYRIFLIQGVVMALCSCIMAAAFGTGVYGGAVALLNNINNSGYIFSLSPMPYVIACGVSFAVVVGTFAVQMFKLSRKTPLEYGAAQAVKDTKRRRKITKFSKLWKFAAGKSNRSQMIMSALLVAVSMGILVFGLFYGEIQGMGRYYDLQSQDKYNYDFNLAVTSGSNAIDALNVNIPVGSGVTPENCEKLKETPNLKVNMCASALFNHTYLLTDNTQQNASVLAYTKRVPNLEKVNDSGDQTTTRQQMNKAGFTASQQLYPLNVAGIEDTALDAYTPYITDGAMDMAKFNLGEQVAAVGNDFKVGDTITVSYLTYSKKINDDITAEAPQVHNFNVTVGAVYSQNAQNYNDAIIQNSFGEGAGYILMCSKPMIQADPYLAYDIVTVDFSGDAKDNDAVNNARMTINSIAEDSVNVQVFDYLNTKEKYAEIERVYKIPVFIIVIIIMLIVLAALTITNIIRVKSSLKNYALMRAIGMDMTQLTKRLVADTLKYTIAGVLAGGGATIIFEIIIAASQVMSYNDIVLYTVLPAFLIGSCAVVAISVISCIVPVHWVKQQDIAASIDSVNY